MTSFSPLRLTHLRVCLYEDTCTHADERKKSVVSTSNSCEDKDKKQTLSRTPFPVQLLWHCRTFAQAKLLQQQL